jgi:hypothetical protein
MTLLPEAKTYDDGRQAARLLLEILQGETEAPEASELDRLILRLVASLDIEASNVAKAAAEALRALLALDSERENEMIIDALMHDAELAIASFLR